MAAELTRRELLALSLSGLHLLKKADRRTVVSSLGGLQAQFAMNPRESLRIRARDFDENRWSDGLVKLWTFRNTLHAVNADEAGLYLSAKGENGDWDDGWGIPRRVKPYWSRFLLEQVRSGVGEREALKEACRRRGMDEDSLSTIFHGWGGLLKEMADRGMIAYEGGTGKRFVALTDVAWLPREEALRTLMARYFRHYGPATLTDCATFMGLPMTQARPLFQKLLPQLTAWTCEGKTYYTLGEPAACSLPPCLFLAGFDPLIMGYKDRSRFLDPADKTQVMTNTGICFPTVLVRGRLRARWKVTGKTLRITAFAPLTPADRERIEARGRRLFAGRDLSVVFEQ